MRLSDITPAQRRLLEEIRGRISDRLEAHFTELPGTPGLNIGVSLKEQRCSVVVEVPGALLDRATGNAADREVLRTRIKGRRDRMLFKPPPPPLPKNIASAMDPAWSRFGGGGGGGRRR